MSLGLWRGRGNRVRNYIAHSPDSVLVVGLSLRVFSIQSRSGCIETALHFSARHVFYVR
jgi:hypothetical protein